MARTQIAAQNTSPLAALNPIDVDAANADGNAVVNNGQRVLFVHNRHTGGRVITQVTGATAGGVAIADPQVTVAAGDFAVLGPWPPAVFNQGDGTVHINYDGVTALDVAVIDIPRAR